MVHGPDSGLHFHQEEQKVLFLCSKLPAGIGNDSLLLVVVSLGEDGAEASWLAVIP